MVTDDNQSLDEYILQIFEEQEEAFYFPVTSQKTARSFVKALYNKGLPYERLYREIGEFEHNFSAWRKGLGRIGIGNRIIERINRPLETVLISDDEEDIQEILTRLKAKVKDADLGNNRVPPITGQRDQSQPISDHRDRLQPTKDHAKSRSDSVMPSGDKVAPSGDQYKRENDRNSTDSWRQSTDAKTKALSDEANDKNSWSSCPQLSRTSASHPLVGGQLEQKEPGLVDFRSVLKRHVENDKLKIGERIDRRSVPPSFNPSIKSDVDRRSRLSTSLDKINRREKADDNHAPGEPLTDRHNKTRAGSEPRDTQYHAETVKRKQKEDTERTREKVTEVDVSRDYTDSLKSKQLKTNDSNNDVNGSDSSNQEPLPTQEVASVKTEAPLAAEESDYSTSETTTTSDSEKTEASSVDDDDDDDDNDDEEDDKADDPDGQDDEIRTSTDSVDDTDDRVAAAIDENYDSDWDSDNDDLSPEGRRLVRQMTEYKCTAAPLDGPGYLYVLTDGGRTSPMTTGGGSLIKVGVSRFPKRRHQQALRFNVDVELTISLPVSLRRRCAEQARKRLDAYKINDRDGWYRGPLVDMLDVVRRMTVD
ncbi:hypothetical protein LSH36_1071g00009 [Paralvinella palmiformis]|uniref:Uncharacterized protein n=1 Tax=Paralvinella palmiformis TaxID=53620 RepID=A0AAD9IWG1_9ANNE|nr:hypothetical protein LSH36_1071g00009 [Paralvinella palmiformis]